MTVGDRKPRRVSANAHTTWVVNAAQLLLDDPKDAIDTGRPIGAEKVDEWKKTGYLPSATA
jgi:hypothetical protein